MNYEKNKKYFKKSSNTLSIVLIIIGVMSFFIVAGSALFGIIFIAAGIGLIILKKKTIITDEEYDNSVATQLADFQGRALNKLGIDIDEVSESAPITFGNYSYKGASLAKLGKDGFWRTNKYEQVILFFAANEVHCYTYRYDTIEKKQNEETDVYFYRDIVSVSTFSETSNLLGFDVEHESFKLTTAGGTAITVSVRNGDDNVQRSINAMRSLLKNKKMSLT